MNIFHHLLLMNNLLQFRVFSKKFREIKVKIFERSLILSE